MPSVGGRDEGRKLQSDRKNKQEKKELIKKRLRFWWAAAATPSARLFLRFLHSHGVAMATLAWPHASRATGLALKDNSNVNTAPGAATSAWETVVGGVGDDETVQQCHQVRYLCAVTTAAHCRHGPVTAAPCDNSRNAVCDEANVADWAAGNKKKRKENVIRL